MVTITQSRKISDNMLKSIFTTAIEGGSAYWANEYNDLEVIRSEEKGDYNGYVIGFEIGDPDENTDCSEPPVNRKITLEDFGKALKTVLENGGHKDFVHQSMVDSILNQIDYEEDCCYADGYECDAVLQVAVFGKVIYG